MATFDNILNSNLEMEMYNIPDNKLITGNDKDTSYNNDIDTNSQEILFTFDKTKKITINDIPYINMRYQDSSKIYVQKKQLGKYKLKNHQLTSLYHMIGLENMLYKVKTIKYENDPNDYINDRLDHKIKNTNPDTSPKVIEKNTLHFTNVGILSDKVGSGKSYCIMALINESKSLNNKSLPFRNINHGSNILTKPEINKLDTNILLVPHSLVGQWKKYLDNSGLKFFIIQKNKDIWDLTNNTCIFKNNNTDNTNTDNTDTDNINDTSNTNTPQSNIPQPSPRKGKIKVTITKKTKAQIAKEAAEKLQKAPEDVPIPISNEDMETETELVNLGESVDKGEKDNLPDSIEKLEEMKKEINTKILKNNKEIDRYYSSQIYNINDYNSRQNIINKQNELSNLAAIRININNKMQKILLNKGTIKNTDIAYINECITSNEIKYLHDNLKMFYDNIGHIDKDKIQKYDVILISSTFYNLFSILVKKDNYTVNRLIIDECNSIKGVNLSGIKNIFTWLITSSIASLQTNTMYLKNIKPIEEIGFKQNNDNMYEKCIFSSGFIKDLINDLYQNNVENNKLYLINNPEYIEQSMKLPDYKLLVLKCLDNINIKVLNGLVSPEILQMLNAGNIDGIIEKMDISCGTESNIINIITCKYKDELRIKEYEIKVAVENPKYNPACETMGLINKRKALDDLKNKISCIEERIKTVETCPICCEEFRNPIITDCCNNKFCFDCMAMSLKSNSRCPICRCNMSIKNINIIRETEKIKVKSDTKSSIISNPVLQYEKELNELFKHSESFSKYDNMDKIFELNYNNRIKKYLIFSEYDNSFNYKITNILDKWGLKYKSIQGTSATITKNIEKYKNEDVNVLLLNSRYFGSGLNLENTSDIIIIHKMAADIEMQIIGRAQRYGRINELRVWKLYYKNEIN